MSLADYTSAILNLRIYLRNLILLLPFSGLGTYNKTNKQSFTIKSTYVGMYLFALMLYLLNLEIFVLVYLTTTNAVLLPVFTHIVSLIPG